MLGRYLFGMEVPEYGEYKAKLPFVGGGGGCRLFLFSFCSTGLSIYARHGNVNVYTLFAMTLKCSRYLKEKPLSLIVKVKTVLKFISSLRKPSKSQCRGCGTLHVPVSVGQSKKMD